MWHIYKTANGAVSKLMREAEKCVFAICVLNCARVRRRVSVGVPASSKSPRYSC